MTSTWTQSPGARYIQTRVIRVRCGALHSFEERAGDGTVTRARPRREIIVVYEERKRAPPDVYMVSSMIAFTMSPSFARSALTALDREQDAWDMTSSTD